MRPSFETHRSAMLLRMRALPAAISNPHGEERRSRDASRTMRPRYALFREPELDQVCRAGTDMVVVAQFEDQPGIGFQLAERTEHGGPADVAFTRCPVAVAVAVAVLHVDMCQHAASRFDIV